MPRALSGCVLEDWVRRVKMIEGERALFDAAWQERSSPEKGKAIRA